MLSTEVQKAMEQRESHEQPGKIRNPEEAHSSPMMDFCGARPRGPGGSEVTLNHQPEEACHLGDRIIISNPYEDARGERNGLPPMTPLGAPFRLAPDTCDGTTDLEEYLVYFEQLSMLDGWKRPTKAMMLGLALRGVARSVLTSPSFTQRQNFLEVAEALKQNFSLSQQVQTHPAELWNRKRKVHKPLTELGCDIRRFVCLAYPRQIRLPWRP